jgi:hypothetical protein
MDADSVRADEAVLDALDGWERRSGRARGGGQHGPALPVIDAAGERRHINFTLSVDEATAILSVVQSEDTLAMYVEERGWCTEQRREWTTRTLQRGLSPAVS